MMTNSSRSLARIGNGRILMVPSTRKHTNNHPHKPASNRSLHSKKTTMQSFSTAQSEMVRMHVDTMVRNPKQLHAISKPRSLRNVYDFDKGENRKTHNIGVNGCSSTTHIRNRSRNSTKSDPKEATTASEGNVTRKNSTTRSKERKPSRSSSKEKQQQQQQQQELPNKENDIIEELTALIQAAKNSNSSKTKSSKTKSHSETTSSSKSKSSSLPKKSKSNKADPKRKKAKRSSSKNTDTEERKLRRNSSSRELIRRKPSTSEHDSKTTTTETIRTKPKKTKSLHNLRLPF